jgi:nucleotide-binding universal stress UspA family protein
MDMTTPRLLVVANETVEGSVLVDTVRDLAHSQHAEVLVVAPALNSRLRHWMSDSDAAVQAARCRLGGCLARLRAAGVSATGHVGDADPLRAIEDALRVSGADEIVIGTHPEEISNWLAHDLVGRACARFGLPVAHVVVDIASRQEYLAA